MRTIIIGDIHGCSGALRLLLAKILPDEKADRLILLGDLLGRIHGACSKWLRNWRTNSETGLCC